MDSNTEPDPRDPDKLRTFRNAAEAMNLPYFKVQQAAKKGVIPTYSFLNGRKYVRVRDIELILASSSTK